MTDPTHRHPGDPVDPLWVLWRALGSPTPENASMDKTGPCARCGIHSGHASRVKKVVSDKFTGWDAYTHALDPLWCLACTWAHTAIEARTRTWHIDAAHTVEATPDLLAGDLSTALPYSLALVVPLSRHKHILPSALWGHVTTDDRVLPWTADEAARFQTFRWLRGLGFNETALTQPTPRFEQFITLDTATMGLVLHRWADLSDWRKDTTYLKVAAVASRTSKVVAA